MRPFISRFPSVSLVSSLMSCLLMRRFWVNRWPSCQRNGCELTIIDTPGHADFTIEVERSLRILDFGHRLVFGGVRRRAAIGDRLAAGGPLRRAAPVLRLINLTEAGAGFARTVSEIAGGLGAAPLVLQLPLGADRGEIPCGAIRPCHHANPTWSAHKRSARRRQRA